MVLRVFGVMLGGIGVGVDSGWVLRAESNNQSGVGI
jgi:hypothetical protein